MKGKLVVALVALAVVFVWFRSSGVDVDLADGSFLVYRQGESTVRLTFRLADGDRYRTLVELTDGGGPAEVAQGMPGHDETVDGRMRTASGAYFELASFGPLWVTPGQLEEGGSAYGTRISEIRTWHGRDVAVVSASVGGGALQGEWLYDVATGFLVGGTKGASFAGQSFGYELVEADVPGLVVP